MAMQIKLIVVVYRNVFGCYGVLVSLVLAHAVL